MSNTTNTLSLMRTLAKKHAAMQLSKPKKSAFYDTLETIGLMRLLMHLIDHEKQSMRMTNQIDMMRKIYDPSVAADFEFKAKPQSHCSKA